MSSSASSSKGSSSKGPAVVKKNEIQELQDDLINNNENIKKEAIRKIIDAMTRGKDVSMLFPHVLRNMMTKNMELKKLIYLYIINYAKTKPDLVILAINSFKSDAADPSNPMLRSLAVRTMGCIRVKEIIEYLLDALKKAVKDENPYVRKTAAICIAKIYETYPQLVVEQGFLQQLEYLLNDSNAMVIANAVCAQMQIQDIKGGNILELNKYKVQKLRTAMNECNEWGVIYILDALAVYRPDDTKEAEDILERVIPRLSHQNPGVILSATRVIMKYLDYLTDPEMVINYCKKLTSPLISLLNMEPEIVFIALKNINLILQKRPIIIEKEIKFFFCNFNDPIYIKVMKIEILIRLANIDNIPQILHQLKEYSAEVDIEIAKKSIRAIGRCAIKLDKAAQKCVQVLRDCLRSKDDYVTQETIIVIRDIFRKYPKDYEGLLKEICENLKTLDNPEAKAAMIWIIGEYVDTIENSGSLLEEFVKSFIEEPAIVQHQILTSCVKLFLMRPQDGYDLVHKLLQQATNNCENPDIRDRGYIYWRLLGQSPELAKKIVYSERPEISDNTYVLETALLDKLIENIGTLSSVYYKPPEQFVKHLRDIINQKEMEENEAEEAGDEFFIKGENNIADNDYYGGDVQIQDDKVQQQQSNIQYNMNSNIQNSQIQLNQNSTSSVPSTAATNNQSQAKNLLDDDDDLVAPPQQQQQYNQPPPAQVYQQPPPQQQFQPTPSQPKNLNLLDDDEDNIGGASTAPQPQQMNQMQYNQSPQAVNNTQQASFGSSGSNSNNNTDFFGGGSQLRAANIKIPFSECVNENKFSMKNIVNGLNIACAFQREGAQMFLEIQVSNRFGNNTFSDFAIKLAPNKFKINPTTIDLNKLGQVAPGQTSSTKVEIDCNGQIDNGPLSSPFLVNTMIKTNFDVYQMSIPCSLSVLIVPGAALSIQQYGEYASRMVKKADKIPMIIDRDALVKKMANNNIYFVNSQTNPQGIEMINFSCKLANEMPLLLDVIIDKMNGALNIQYHAPHDTILPLFYQAIMFVLKF
ncbi:hypothetical protein ABPG74_016130 [Tetrahymena malaccensis]